MTDPRIETKKKNEEEPDLKTVWASIELLQKSVTDLEIKLAEVEREASAPSQSWVRMVIQRIHALEYAAFTRPDTRESGSTREALVTAWIESVPGPCDRLDALDSFLAKIHQQGLQVYRAGAGAEVLQGNDEENDNPYGEWSNDPTCPHCGTCVAEEVRDAEIDDGDIQNMECPECGEPFHAMASHTPEFSLAKGYWRNPNSQQAVIERSVLKAVHRIPMDGDRFLRNDMAKFQEIRQRAFVDRNTALLALGNLESQGLIVREQLAGTESGNAQWSMTAKGNQEVRKMEALDVF